MRSLEVELEDIEYQDYVFDIIVEVTGDKEFDGDNPQPYWYIGDLTITSLVSLHQDDAHIYDVVHDREKEPELFASVESNILGNEKLMWYLADRWEDHERDQMENYTERD